MKCPFCNGASRVLETRATAQGIKRRRQCSMGHQFPTLEHIPATEMMADRDKQIIKRLSRGDDVQLVANDYGITRRQVLRIARREIPGFDGRDFTTVRKWRGRTEFQKGRRVQCKDAAGRLIATYDSATDAAQAIRGTASGVAQAARGTLNTYKGFTWTYLQ